MKHRIHTSKSRTWGRVDIHCANCPCGTSTLVVCGNSDYKLWGDAELFLKALTDELWDWP